MNLIAAVDENWGIGKNNDLLFRIPEDMKFFRSKTIGKNVICGKNTLLSFPGGNPLPDRKHFVLTHGTLPKQENLVAVNGLDDLFSAIQGIPEEEIFVIGGASVYSQLLPFCKKAYITKIFASDPEAEQFLANLDRDPDFSVVDPGEKLVSKNGLTYSFITYERK